MEHANRRGLSGSTLKLMAIVAMALDHIAWTLLDPQLTALDLTVFPQLPTLANLQAHPLLYILSYLFHFIGRITFPLMLFFLAEGITHTRNFRCYALRLLLFALLSEIPYDLAFSGTAFDYTDQNVFFTLFLSLIAMYAIRKLRKDPPLAVAVVAFCAVGAWLLQSDYGFEGVLMACVMELLHEKKTLSYLFGSLIVTPISPCEITALLALPAVHAYNGQRGRRLKYFFYIFYPAHLLFLFAISKWLLG